ncbi:hypothetical protein PM082_020010 [Marasmius tenuissimus]|nr:hypothetical protein PM082_020010 [Marasmius tenuissimus]
MSFSSCFSSPYLELYRYKSNLSNLERIYTNTLERLLDHPRTSQESQGPPFHILSALQSLPTAFSSYNRRLVVGAVRDAVGF